MKSYPEAHSHLLLHLLGIQHPLLAPMAPTHTHAVYIHIFEHTENTPKIMNQSFSKSCLCLKCLPTGMLITLPFPFPINSRNPIKSCNSPRHTEYIQLHFDKELGCLHAVGSHWARDKEVPGDETRGRLLGIRQPLSQWSLSCLSLWSRRQRGRMPPRTVKFWQQPYRTWERPSPSPLPINSFQQPSSTVLGEGEGKPRPLGPWGFSGDPALLRGFLKYVLWR